MKTTHFLPLFALAIIQVHCSSSSETSQANGAKYGLTADQYTYVRLQTVKGGNLDFESKLDPTKLVIINDVAYNPRAAGLYAWARFIKKLGVPDKEKAIALYEEVSSVTLRDSQRQAIRNGFDAKSD